MSSRRSPRSPRTSRSPEVLERLERSRARIRERRALARQRERTIADAVKRYLNDWQAIRACETKRDQEIEVLREQISVVESRATAEIARYHADQALAAALIRDQGQSDDDVAQLLEVNVKHARQLINAGRATGDLERDCGAGCFRSGGRGSRTIWRGRCGCGWCSPVRDRLEIAGSRWGLDGSRSHPAPAFDTYWTYHLTREHQRVHLDHQLAA